MHVITWRAPDELVEQVRAAARGHGHSVNEYLTRVLTAATDPELAGTDAQRVRERLAAAGLLAPTTPVTRRPDPQRVAEARRRAGRGTPLADVVTGDRG